MPVALVVVALILTGGALGGLFLVRPYADKLFALLDRAFPTKEGTGPSEPLPVDLYAHAHRFQRKESHESETAAIYELKNKLGSWENVRVALGVSGNLVDQ